MVKLIGSNTILPKEKKHKTGVTSRYESFCKDQEKQGVIWYLIPLMTLPSVIMPISITAMSYFPGYIVFIGISMLFFFVNIVLTIAEQSTKIKITFYLITVLFHIAIPLIAFLFDIFS